MPETTTEPTALADLAARWERQSAEYLADWQDYDSHDGQERRGQGIALGDAASELRAALTDPTRKSDWRVDRRGANAGSCRACVTGAPHEPWTDEEAGFVEEALRCSDADSSGHWPTAAGWLACEVRRLRAALAAAPAEQSSRDLTAQEVHDRDIDDALFSLVRYWAENPNVREVVAGRAKPLRDRLDELLEATDSRPAAAPAEGYPDAEGLAVLAENEGRPVSPDDAHTETVTEYRVMAGEHRIGTSGDLSTARYIAEAPQFAGRSDVRVEFRTVTTSRRESEWKATDQ